MVERVVAAAGVLHDIQQSVCVRVKPVHPDPMFFHILTDSRFRCDDLRDGVGATGNNLVAALALPDANGLALDGVLAAEGANVAGVLGDFHLLHLLTQGGTVSVEIVNTRFFAVRSFSFGDHGRASAVARVSEEHTWYRIYR